MALPISELLKRTLVIVAHADDECIGAGALMQRMEHAALVFCTDGGPRDSYFWNSYGSREAYARIRQEEAIDAAKAIGIARPAFVPITDQELYLNLPYALEALEGVLRDSRPDAILTLAYEGGHPDHDCCGFLGHLLGERHRLPVWELPLYHRTREGPRHQEFLFPADGAHTIVISDDELTRKRKMLEAYKSQGNVLDAFDLSLERFRPQAEYDFSRPPRTDVINYEFWQWSMTAAQVCSAFSAFKSVESTSQR